MGDSFGVAPHPRAPKRSYATLPGTSELEHPTQWSERSFGSTVGVAAAGRTRWHSFRKHSLIGNLLTKFQDNITEGKHFSLK